MKPDFRSESFKRKFYKRLQFETRWAINNEENYLINGFSTKEKKFNPGLGLVAP